MANLPASGLNLNTQPNPDIFPNNMYRCLHPRYVQHYPVDMDTVISTLAPNVRKLLGHGKVKDDLVHVQTNRVFNDKDYDFGINLDVGIFAPEELTVKIIDDHLIIEGKHEERQAHDMGYVTRNFKRRYELPKGYNPDAVVSKLSLDGVLSVTLPKTTNDPKVRVIPIQYTGSSYLFIKNNSEYDETKNVDKEVEMDDIEKEEDQMK